jgi:HlyD family secretion protein
MHPRKPSVTIESDMKTAGRGRTVAWRTLALGTSAVAGVSLLALSLAAGPFASHVPRGLLGTSPAAAQKATTAEVAWVAAAPGRVEPKSGQVQIATAMPERVRRVLVKINEKVEAGDLLVQLADDEPRARLAAAESEVDARKKERDAAPATSGREEVRRAEDAVYAAERTVTNARFALDAAVIVRAINGGSGQAVADARRRLQDALDRLRREQVAYATAFAKTGIPGPNRLEAGIQRARAEVAVAEALLDKTRIRAPITGTVLQVHAKVGELVVPSVELPLVVMGDMSSVRVRAEVDEHDVAKVKLGQRAFVRNVAHPGRDFEGRVVEIAPLLALPKMTARGPRRPSDVEVLEVIVELDGTQTLLPGMRADVFFRR